MPATLDYTVTTPAASAATPQQAGGYPLQVSVTATGMDPKVFVFQQVVPSAGASNLADTFYSVASAAQLANLPADAAIAGCPFYRLASLDLVFSCFEDLERALGNIEFMLGALLRAVNTSALTAPPVTTHLS